MNRLLCLLITCSFALSLSAQQPVPDTTAAGKKHVVFGLNVTSTLASVLGTNLSSNLGSSGFLLTLRTGTDKNHCRMGLDFKISNQHQPASVFNSDNTQNETTFKYRIGYGSIIPVSKICAFYWGLDGMLLADNSKITTLNQQTGVVSTLKDATWGFGLGPVFGFHWQVHPRVLLSTESSVYAIYKTRKQSVDAQPDTTEITENSFSWQPLLPTSLFINFVF
jgi:hypothetical protein